MTENRSFDRERNLLRPNVQGEGEKQSGDKADQPCPNSRAILRKAALVLDELRQEPRAANQSGQEKRDSKEKWKHSRTLTSNSDQPKPDPDGANNPMSTTSVWRIITPVVVALALSVSIAGCGQHFDKIGDINGNPQKYLHNEVTIRGHVTKVYELPLGITNLAAYRVSDDSGQIWVISHNGAPGDGDRIALKGTVESAGDVELPIVGNILGPVIHEEQRRAE